MGIDRMKIAQMNCSALSLTLFMFLTQYRLDKNIAAQKHAFGIFTASPWFVKWLCVEESTP